ncbi:hypothetical protein RN629_00240 [Sphingomonadaceae bacterium jetA1]|jgi:hypothetical protein|uniref:hypothetical protein n=1 Tax=Facivitalis istanbulensis TaxID=3075838 RepID=UPI003485F0F4
MQIDIAATLADAWAMFRRDRDLLIRIAGPFLFWPALALGLLVPPPPMPDEAAAEATARAMMWIDAVGAWAGHYGAWYFASYVVGMIGTATMLSFELGGGAPTVGQALRRALAMAPRFLLAMILVALPVGAGMLLYILPGVYIAGRLLVVGPVLFAERRMPALAAIGRSVILTRGTGLAMAGLAACTYLGGIVATQPFLALLDLVQGGGPGKLVVVALLQIGAAAVTMAAGVAQALIAVAAYRRLASRGI